jgi:aspartyl-tRNA(Asn)/glutamyl-tRNA(Gln) amidotransferase subunit B
MAKQVFTAITTGNDPVAFVEEKGLKQLSDPAILKPIIDEILDNNQQSVTDFHNGKDRAVGFLVGQIMKQTKGNANPNVVNELLMAGLSERA